VARRRGAREGTCTAGATTPQRRIEVDPQRRRFACRESDFAVPCLDLHIDLKLTVLLFHLPWLGPAHCIRVHRTFERRIARRDLGVCARARSYAPVRGQTCV
jgi:hypothetical protein